MGFLRFGWKTENIIFGAEKVKNRIFQRTRMKVYVITDKFLKEKIFFFVFFYDFLKNETSFSEKKKLRQFSHAYAAKFY